MKKKVISLFVAALLCTITVPMAAFAGNMNSNEQSVYNAASGTFTYDGKTYKAAETYLAQLSAYLNQDDIDLTADQANQAITEMNASIEEGVKQGYILPTDGGSGSTDSESEGGGASGDGNNSNSGTDKPSQNTSDKNNTGNDTEKDSTEDTEKKDSSGGNTDNTNGGASTGEGEATSDPITAAETTEAAKNTTGLTINGIDYADITPAQEEAIKSTLESMPKTEEAELKLDYDITTKTLTYTAADGTVYHLPDDMNSQTFSGITGKVKTSSIVMCVLSVVCAILLLLFGCMRFQKKKPSFSTHGNRSVIRKVTGIILVAITAVDLTFFGITAVLETTYVNQANIMDSFAASGYYQTAHASLQKDVHSILSALGLQETICDEAMSYENFLFDSKNQMSIAIKGQTPSSEFTKVQTGVTKALSEATIKGHTMGETNQMLVSTAVMSVYQTAAEDVFGRMIYNCGKIYRETMQFSLILMGISLAVAVILFMAGGRYIHRGIRKIAYSFGVSGVLMLGLTIAFFAQNWFTNMHSTVEAFYVFIQNYIVSGETVCYSVAIGMILTGGILYFISRSVRKHVH